MTRRTLMATERAVRDACAAVRRLGAYRSVRFGENSVDAEFIAEIGRLADHRLEWCRERDSYGPWMRGDSERSDGGQ